MFCYRTPIYFRQVQILGPDGLYPRVLKEMADVIWEPLNEIFQNSWTMGELPEDW